MKAAVFTIGMGAYKAKKVSPAGAAVKRVVEQIGFEAKAGVLPNDKTVVEAVLRQLSDAGTMQMILTVGSTGPSEKSCAPDALAEAAERLLPGIPEAVRAYNVRYSKKVILDRSAAGIRNKTVLVNLPDSVKLAKEGVEYILPELMQTVELLNV